MNVRVPIKQPRGRGNVEKERHAANSLKGQSISKQLFSSFKKGWGEQARYQSEGIKFIHPLFLIQNGRFASAKRSSEREQFYVQGGPESCLLLCSFAYEPSKISMGRKHLRVHVSIFWFGSSISDFYKIIKDSHCSFEADSNQNNHLSGRHVADESDYKRSKSSQGHIDFSVAESRLCNKSAEICAGALAKDRVSRSGNRLGENDINIATGKSKQIEIEMSKAYFKTLNDIMGSNQPFRFYLLNSTGSATSYATDQVFTTTANRSYKKQFLLPVCNTSEPRFYSRTAMVVQQPGDLQWQTNCVSNLQKSNTIRCLQEGLVAYYQEVSTGGQWSLQESKLHINVLEVLAIKLAFLTFPKMLDLKSIHFQVENMSALS